MFTWIQQMDEQMLLFLQAHSTPFLDALTPALTYLGSGGILWIVAALALLASKKYRPYGTGMLLSLLLGLIIGNGVIKHLVMRPRPCDAAPIAHMLIAHPADLYSFPSGHALSSFAAASVLYRADKRLGIPALALAALISFSRLYLYVHYPSDVLAGALLGLAVAFLGMKLNALLWVKWQNRAQNRTRL